MIQKSKFQKTFTRALSLGFYLTGLAVGLFLINQKTSFLNRAYETVVGKEANLVVDVQTPAAAFQNWGYLAQGGEEKGGMLAEVEGPVRSLHPSYIRLDHVFDFYDVVSRDAGGNLVFDFSKLDAEIAVIRRTGAIPFISLSYMPSAISAGNEVDNPGVWSEWRQLVRRTIEHISGTRGLNISDVYYEVWNEPDLFGNFKLQGNKNYLDLYHYAALGAREAQSVRPFYFGGPATTGLYKNWFDGLIKYSVSNNLRLDFVSWHRYSYKIEDFVADVENAQEWKSKFPEKGNLIFAVTETGPDSEVNSIYDTKMSAVHLLAIHAATYGKVQMIFDFEIKDGPGPAKNWGRWGILTHENYGPPVAKPRYRAIEFLNKMVGAPIVTTGQGSWVKAFSLYSPSENIIRLLIVNYDRFASHKETVPIRFTNMPFRNFTVRRINFMGGTTESQTTITGNTWVMNEDFPPNSSAIIELESI